MAQKAMKVETVKIGSVAPDPANARRHGPKNMEAIKGSLMRFGQQKPIVVDGRGVVRAGNGTLQAAKALGWTEIAVVRSDLPLGELTAYAIADNRSAELAEWDESVLVNVLGDEAIGDVGFTIDDIGEMDARVNPVEIEEDEVPSNVPQRCSAGDLWTLGAHRLLCGDSTKAEDVARLLGDRVPFIMVTDPPYGVEYDPTARRSIQSKNCDPAVGLVENDDRADWTSSWKLFSGAVAYVWHAGKMAGDVALDLLNADILIRGQVIWTKPKFVVGRAHYQYQHEPCWYAVRNGQSSKWCGDRTQSTVWEISNKRETEDSSHHSTQKPVECMARPIRNHGGKDDDVYDPFLGSGTTIIAAEQLGRRCFGLEISPKYCDIIIERWERFTGNKAEKLNGTSRA